MAIVGQIPTGIKGLAKDPWAVARENRLKAELRGDGINRNRALQQGKRTYRGAEQGDAVAFIASAEIALTMPGIGFGVGLDQDGRAGVILLGIVEHLAKAVGIGPATGHAGIASGLVDHQNITRIGAGGAWVKGVVL